VRLHLVLPTMIGSGILEWYVSRTGWFQTHVCTPMWIFLIPTVGLFLTIGIGLEKIETLGLLRAASQGTMEYKRHSFHWVYPSEWC
jgi:hypothetical protein